MFTLWLAAGVAILFGYIVWDSFAGWFSWGRDFVLAAVAAYVGKRLSYKVEADVGVEDRGE